MLKPLGFQVLRLSEAAGKTDKNLRPTAENIRTQLRKLLQRTTKDDMVLVGLAGHGLQADGSDEAFYCPVDANPIFREQEQEEERDGKKVKVKVKAPANRNSLLSVNELLQILLESGVGHKFLLIDACRNDPKVRGRRGVNYVNVAALPRQTAVLLSCSEGEFSFEPDELRHGVFFYHVLEAFRGQATSADGAITWDALSSYVRENVPARVQQLRGKDGAEQNPQNVTNLAGKPPVLARLTDRSKISPADLSKMPGTSNSFKNSIGMTLNFIPAGEFLMGSKGTPQSLAEFFKAYDANPEYFTGEFPQHKVRITKPFYMAIHEVTIGQFREFVRDQNYKTEAERDGEGGWGWSEADGKFEGRKTQYDWQNTGWPKTDQHPVVNVTWNDANAFCNWLERKEGRKYRLPTEAEWEYACRARTTTHYMFGDDPEAPDGLAKYGNVADAAAKAKWTNYATFKYLAARDGYVFSAPVGSFKANAFGLFDMHGNVWEWCADRYDGRYYEQRVEVDPQGPSTSSEDRRVLRGGSWGDLPWDARSANRFGGSPDGRVYGMGFRVVCVVGVRTP